MALIGSILTLGCYVVIAAILVRVVFSWLSPGSYSNPFYRYSHMITEPMLRPIRNLFPPSGLDFSPAILMVGFSLLAGVFRTMGR